VAIYIVGNPPTSSPLYPSNPTHYVHPAASGSGNGTLSNPFSLAQLRTIAQPGWVVECEEGTYIGPNTNQRNVGTFRIDNAGTAQSPIIVYAKRPAAVNLTGRSILQHTGTVQGQGGAVLEARSYQHWCGFYINEDQAPTTADTGPVVCYGGQSAKFSYMRINRGNGFWNVNDNNRAAIRFEGDGTRNCTVSDCWIENYHGGFVDSLGNLVDAAGSEQGIQIYGPVTMNAQNAVGGFIFEHNFFDNCRTGITSKSINTRLIEGGMHIRRNLFRPSNFNSSGDLQSAGVDFIEMGNLLGRTQVYQNLQFGGAVLCKISRHFGFGAKDIDVINNTCVGLTRNQEFSGFLSSSGDGGNANSFGWRVHNNVKTGTAMARMFRYDTGDTALQSMSHNISNGASPAYWAEHPDVAAHTSLRTLSEWQAATIWDDFSSTADPLFVSQVMGADLGKLQALSPARNAGVDLLNLLGGGTSAPINIGAFITAGMTDVIGIRPLT
jgi:hypothetical protein